MNISQKCQYAIRAVFELARRGGTQPVTIGKMAEAQAIPAKFLELILSELRRGGFVESRRGARGGYLLAVPPGVLTIGDIIRSIDGPVTPVQCIAGSTGEACPLHGHCAFMGMWTRARDAVTEVYDGTTFADLIAEAPSPAEDYMPSYCI